MTQTFQNVIARRKGSLYPDLMVCLVYNFMDDVEGWMCRWMGDSVWRDDA